MHRPVSRCSWEAKGVAEKAQNLWKVCILPESSRGNWGHLEWPQLSTGGNLNAYRRQFESRLYTGIQLQTGTPCMTKMCLQVGAKHPLPSMDSRESLLSPLGQHLHHTIWAAPQLLLTLDKTCTDCKHGHPVHTADMTSVVWIRSQIPP